MSNYKSIVTILFFAVFISFLSFSLVLTNSHNLWAQAQDVEAIFFDSNTNSISPESIAILRKKTDALKNEREFTITLEGYSDITGRADYNLDLSERRAQLVKDYLVELGIDSEKIEVIGKGGTEKYGAGEVNEALQQNRRVNLIVEIVSEPELEEENLETQDLSRDEPAAAQETETEVAQEVAPQTPSLPLGEITEKIEKAVRHSASKGIVFSTPQEMQIGQSYKVEAEVSYPFIEALSKDLDGFKLGNQVGLMLSGSGVDILEKDLSIKTLKKDSPPIWEWEVIPKTQGVNSLILSVAIASQSTVLDDTYPTFHRVIDVNPNMVHSITSSYWVMGILIVLIIFMVGWILIRKVKVN